MSSVNRMLQSLLMISSLLPCLAGGSALADSAKNQAELQKWRADYAKELMQPNGWLALVALEWLKPGATTIGSAADNKIVLQHVGAHVGVLSLDANEIHFHTSQDVGVLVNGAPASHNVIFADDAAKPSEIMSGDVRMTVIHRGERYYLRVKDADSATRRQFHGLQWYAENPRFRVVAKWVPNSRPKMLHVLNVLGQMTDEPSPGYVEFQISGQTVRLEPTGNDTGLFFVFRDATAKSTTYGAGRFLSTEAPSHGVAQPGTVVLDFNYAHNPPCGYTPYATCPLPTPENKLAVPIPAGEKRYHD